MKRKEILGKLEALSQQIGLTIRYEKLGNSRGGLCRVHESYFLFINKSLAENSRIELIAQELSKFDLKEIFMLPEIRQIISKNRVNSNIPLPTQLDLPEAQPLDIHQGDGSEN